MSEKLHTSDKKETSHLIEGVKPIMVCIGSYPDFDDSGGTDEMGARLYRSSKGLHNVNYFSNVSDLNRNNFLNSGEKTYVISILDGFNKVSEGFCDCTGLVVVGLDKETGENISFLTHQDPTKFLEDKKDDFLSHLRQRLIEVKNKCKPGTIDAVIVGGNFVGGRRVYLDSIELLSTEARSALGFKPVVINGPKKESGWDNVYFDNKNRRLYFFRPKVNSEIGSFTVSDLPESH